MTAIGRATSRPTATASSSASSSSPPPSPTIHWPSLAEAACTTDIGTLAEKSQPVSGEILAARRVCTPSTLTVLKALVRCRLCARSSSGSFRPTKSLWRRSRAMIVPLRSLRPVFHSAGRFCPSIVVRNRSGSSDMCRKPTSLPSPPVTGTVRVMTCRPAIRPATMSET